MARPDYERKELVIDEIEELLAPLLRRPADTVSSSHDLVLDASGDQLLSALYDAKLLQERAYTCDAGLWAALIDEFHAAVTGAETAELAARTAVALVRRDRMGCDVRTFAPGDEIPLDVAQGYDLDGDLWQRESTDPASPLRDSWRMTGFNPAEHDPACGGVWMTPFLLTSYGPLTERPTGTR